MKCIYGQPLIFWDLITELYSMHKDDLLHLGNKLQNSSCSTDPKVLYCLWYEIHKVNW